MKNKICKVTVEISQKANAALHIDYFVYGVIIVTGKTPKLKFLTAEEQLDKKMGQK